MAVQPEKPTRGGKKKKETRAQTASTGHTLFGFSLNIWPFHERGEYPATKETHDKLNEQALAGRPVRKTQSQKSE